MLTDEDQEDGDYPDQSNRDKMNGTYAEFDKNGNPIPNQTREEYNSEDEEESRPPKN
jgi:hypothetical protein